MKPNSFFSSVLILSFFYFFLPELQAQSGQTKKTGINKAVKSTEQINKTSKEIQEGSAEMNAQMTQAGENVKSGIKNLKSIIKIFEPIFRLHNKNNSAEEQSNTSIQDSEQSSNQSSPVESTSQEIPSSENEIPSEDFVPESPSYNSDGTANLGNQNHKLYGCYLDVMSGSVLDDIEASENTAGVDLVYTATDYYGSAPMYALLTPAYVKNDVFANYYFRGPRYKDANIPMRQWEEANESEIALTNLTVDKFDKIKNNNQLLAVINQTAGFKEKYESRTKLNGKVFAIRTHLENRDAYALICVLDQFGTTGTNGFLKIKIKVTGFDNNGDGNPDVGLYE